MQKFKVGDKITGTSGLTKLGMYEGKPYTVRECSASRMTLEECFCGATGHHFTFTPNDYDLYEAAIPEPAVTKFNKGDKVKIGDYESEVCLGDLVHATALLGVTNGYYGADLWKFLKNTLGEYSFEEDIDTIIEFREKQKQSLEYFFKPFYGKQNEKDVLLKDIEEQKTILKNQQEFLKELEDKYNSL